MKFFRGAGGRHGLPFRPLVPLEAGALALPASSLDSHFYLQFTAGCVWEWGFQMKPLALAALAALGIGLSGCATVFEGTMQDITVTTNPPGAECIFYREGLPIGTIPTTPGILAVRKLKHDITIKCNKPGYQEAQYLNNSGLTAVVGANVAVDLILTAGLSSIVDSSTGADNKYDSNVNITMIPLGMVPPTADQAPAAAAAPPQEPATEPAPVPGS